MGKSCPVICSMLVVSLGIFYYFVAAVLLIGSLLIEFEHREYPPWIIIIAAVLYVLLGMLLLAGAVKEKEKCVLAYLVISTTILMIGVFRAIYVLYTIAAPPVVYFISLAILFLIGIFHYFVYVFYLYLCVKNKSANDDNEIS